MGPLLPLVRDTQSDSFPLQRAGGGFKCKSTQKRDYFAKKHTSHGMNTRTHEQQPYAYFTAFLREF